VEGDYHCRISTNQGLAIRIIQSDRQAVTPFYRTTSQGCVSRTTRISQALTWRPLPAAIPDEMLELYAFIFGQGGFRQLGMTFEQFLLVAAAIKPADLPATREDAQTR
jgi:hypothetical protein